MKYKSSSQTALLTVSLSVALFTSGCGAVGRQANTNETALDSYGAAQVEAGKGDCRMAEALYRTAVQRDPHFVEALVGLATCAQQLGDYKTAVDAYNQAISIDSSSYRLYLGRGSVEGLEGFTEAAVRDLRVALAYAPRQVSAYIDIAQTFANQNQLVHAVAAITKAIRLDPERSDLYRIRAAYNQGGQNFGAAQSDYRLALATARDSSSRAEAFAGSATAYQQAGDLGPAISAIQQTLALVKNNAAYYTAAGSIYTSALRFDDAIRAFSGALPYTQDSASRAQVRMQLGDVYMKVGNPAAARGEYALARATASDASLKRALQAKISALDLSERN